MGANYWPASCGVEMWREWPEAEIEADLRLMAELGLNTVRFFLRWQDFEPEAGRYDGAALARLDAFLGLCARHGILAQPSLFIGWMSGGLFWPEWKGRRNLYSDPFVVARGEEYVRAVARRLRAHRGALWGVDLGNELDALDESPAASPAEVRAWCGAMTRVLHEELPGVLVHSGCDKGQIVKECGWRLGEGWQPGVDVLTVHAYPVPGWHPARCGGLADAFTQSLLPFYVRCARAFGPVLAQEFGTIAPGESPRCDAYLRAVLPACVRAGANGLLWWCLRDIGSRGHPYSKNNFEGSLGLVDASGRVKPGLAYYLEFARAMGEAPPVGEEAAGGTAIYWPEHYYARDVPENPGNAPERTSARMLVANHALATLAPGAPGPAVVRGGRAIPAGIRTLVAPGVCLTPDEIDALREWVARGGRLIWNGVGAANWGPAMNALTGARVVDYHPPRDVAVEIDGVARVYRAGVQGIRIEAEPAGASVLWRDGDGLPVAFRHGIGDRGGVVLTGLPDVEGSALAGEAGDRFEPALAWYRGMLGA